MRKEYDFSKGKRGKFFRKDAVLNLPIYLDPDTRAFVEEIAARKKSDLSKVVNDLIKKGMQVPEHLK